MCRCEQQSNDEIGNGNISLHAHRQIQLLFVHTYTNTHLPIYKTLNANQLPGHLVSVYGVTIKIVKEEKKHTTTKFNKFVSFWQKKC